MFSIKHRYRQLKTYVKYKKIGYLDEDFERDLVCFGGDANIDIMTPCNRGYMEWPYNPYLIAGIPRNPPEIGKDTLASRICLHFLDDGVEPIKMKNIDEAWMVTNDDIENIRQLLSQPGPYAKQLAPATTWTMWNYACYVWNDNMFYIESNGGNAWQEEKDFITGKFDIINRGKPNYVPFSTPMPEWKPLQ